MSRYQSVMCDRPNCGKIKREANHWLKGAAIHGGYILADADSFDPPKLNGQHLIVDDFCSEQCALAIQATHLRPVN